MENTGHVNKHLNSIETNEMSQNVTGSVMTNENDIMSNASQPVAVFAEILALCRPGVASAMWVAGR